MAADHAVHAARNDVAHDAPLDGPGAAEFAREHIARAALSDGGVGRVGLELEFHVVDLSRPHRRPTWDEVTALADGIRALPNGSSVTLEPGGQLELSTPPGDDVATAVAALQADRRVLAAALATDGYGTAPLGTDPARPLARVNPAARYVAMERHFAAIGCEGPGRAMMSATAALQINLDAGPRTGWASRLQHIRDLSPVLVAASACSPLLAGRGSAWRSMRQEIWHGIDAARGEPAPGPDPADSWAQYALDTPVMLVHDGDAATALTERLTLRDWLAGARPAGRAPTLSDVDYHLTTLFPPIRPRGYLEIRCVDALPDRWWPALAALTAVLADDPVAADAAAEACEPVREAWTAAARDGLGDDEVFAAVRGCVDVAARRCPPALKADVEAYAELIERRLAPGDELLARATATSPLTLLEEEARAGTA